MAHHEIRTIAFQRSTLSDHAYQSLRDAIISLELAPGQMVFEAELAKSLGVSRTPVREAFRILVEEDLLEILPQRGARVAHISKQKVEEAWFVRTSLEVSACTVVAKKWDSSQEHFKEIESRLNEILRQQEEISRQGDVDKFLESDEEFHRLLLEQAGNNTLLHIVSNMRAHLNRVRHLELEDARHSTTIVSQHAEIFEAIRANRASLAGKLLRQHIKFLQHDFPHLIEKYSKFFTD